MKMKMILLTAIFAVLAASALFGSSSPTEAASCGAKNQRPCKIWERIPSCNSELYEDFKKGLCLSKAVPGRDCGRKNQRACKVWERIPSCNSGLVEDLTKGICFAKAVPGKDCGNANQRPCKVWERIPSCNVNLKEDFAKGICVAVNCGKKHGRPCTVVERIPSCDAGLVENFLKGRCVPSADAERHRIADEKLKQIGGFIASKVQFATQVANNSKVRASLNAGNKTAVAQAVNPSSVGVTQMPDGYLLRTLTIGATAGGKFLFVGTSGGAGAAIDLKGERPVYAYATGDYSFGPGLAAGGGIDVGFWVCQNNKIGGDSWGVEFGVDDLAAAYVGASSLKKGPSIGIGLWFDYDQVFQGFTISPGFGVGGDFGGVVFAGTAVDGDDSIGCDGRPKENPTSATAPGKAGQTIYIQRINYTGVYGSGFLSHSRIKNGAPNKNITRICLVNHTGQPKSIAHQVPGINHLRTAGKGGRSCANFPANVRLNYAYVDREVSVKTDGMNLDYYAGDIVLFEWLGE